MFDKTDAFQCMQSAKHRHRFLLSLFSSFRSSPQRLRFLLDFCVHQKIVQEQADEKQRQQAERHAVVVNEILNGGISKIEILLDLEGFVQFPDASEV